MFRVSFTILVAALMTHSVSAREFSSGTPSMDFNRGELKIPCLAVQNSGSEADDMYFAVTLQQRGNSMNFDVTLAEPDDDAVCGTLDVLANSARSSEPEIHLECQISEGRIRVEVEGEDLPAGTYTATLVSGEVPVSSESQDSIGNEVKFWFDSDESANGTILASNFAAVDDSISASIASETLTLETEAVCIAAPLSQDEESDLDDDQNDDVDNDEEFDDDDANDDDDDDQDEDVSDDDDEIGGEDQNVTEVAVNPGRGNSGQNNGNSKPDKANGNNGNNGKSNKN